VKRRWPAIGLLLLAVVGAVWFFVIRDEVVAPKIAFPEATATLGSDEEAVAVTANGLVLPWLPLPEDAELPELPPVEAPKSGRLAGPMLEQARVLGAAPAELRPYLARSYYGESGVDVELTTGIELRFGDSSQAAKKWKAAAAVLADPSIETLDYVNVRAPARPTIAGSGHTLPPAP
jgi:cell division septal protein FtsQ